MEDQQDKESYNKISSALRKGEKCDKDLSKESAVFFKVPERDLFSPHLIIPLGFLLFFSLAFISYLLDLLNFPSVRTPLAIIFGLTWFFMSVKLCERIPLKFIADLRFQLAILVLIFSFITLAT